MACCTGSPASAWHGQTLTSKQVLSTCIPPMPRTLRAPCPCFCQNRDTADKTGETTLTQLLLTLGFSFSSHLDDHLGPSSSQVPSVGVRGDPVPPPALQPGAPQTVVTSSALAYPGAGSSWPGTAAGAGQGSSYHSPSICPHTTLPRRGPWKGMGVLELFCYPQT